MKKNLQPKSGAAVVVVVLSMIAAGLVGTAILSKATSSRYERVQYGISRRAYYLAESGAAYVRARAYVEDYYPPPNIFHAPLINTFANGDQFIVRAYQTNIKVATVVAGVTNFASAPHIIAESTGVANPGTKLEARRQIYFDIQRRVDPRILDLGFDNNADGEVDEEWQFTPEGEGSTGTPRISTPPEGGDALEMSSWMGNFGFHWSSNPDLDLVRAWSNNNRFMSYDVQAKLSSAKHDGDSRSPVFNSVFLNGIGFRVQADNLSSYGVSFYRFNPNYDRYAPWTNDLDRNTFLNTNVLYNTNIYLTLWSRVYPGKRTIIAYKKLPLSMLDRSPYYRTVNGSRRYEYDLKPFSTILVSLWETNSPAGTTNRVNKITVYMQSTNLYPRWPDGLRNYSYSKWPADTNVFPAPVVWDSPAGRTVVTNNLFTSAKFNILKPPEINLHVYDYATKFFDDFVMRVEGFLSPASMGSQVQY